MKRVLLTGMSGTGKSAVIRALAARGCEAHDLDTPEWSHWIDADPSDSLTPARGKDWVWQEDRVRALLLRPRSMPLFVSGCAENMGRLFHLIDDIVLLSAPVATIMKRLAARPEGGYGSGAHDRRKVRELMSTIEPRLRALASHEIDTQGSPLQAPMRSCARFCEIRGGFRRSPEGQSPGHRLARGLDGGEQPLLRRGAA